jgi:hypothetical protein
VLTYSEAEKACRDTDNDSILITIHSEKEHEFLFDYVFKSHKIVENIWLGLKKNVNNTALPTVQFSEGQSSFGKFRKLDTF